MTTARVVYQRTGSIGIVNYEPPPIYAAEPGVSARASRRWREWLAPPDLRSRAERAIDRAFFPPAIRIDL